MSDQHLTIGGFDLPLPDDHLRVVVLVDELATLHDQHSAHPDPGFLDDLLQEILRRGRGLRLQRHEGDTW